MKTLEKLTNRLKSKKDNNKGFTLVELIVVVVILAIIIGVAITGIYKYVNKARINTDINNASAIQSALAVLATDKTVIGDKSATDTPNSITLKWSQSQSNINATENNNITFGGSGYQDGTKTYIKNEIQNVLSDGVPEAKAGGAFQLEISTDKTGNVVVKCKGYKDTNCTVGQELKAEE